MKPKEIAKAKKITGSKAALENQLSRRIFFKQVTLSGTAYVLAPSVVAHAAGGQLSGTGQSPYTVEKAPDVPLSSTASLFTDQQKKCLAAFCNFIFPNATELGAINYIENLLTAFDFNPPRVFLAKNAPAPFAPHVDSTAEFIPLNRIQERAWRLHIYGSKGVPGGGPNDNISGPVVGIRDLIMDGLNYANRFATVKPGLDLVSDAEKNWFRMSKEFKEKLTELVLESVFSFPEYGGNARQAGWNLSHFDAIDPDAGFSWFDTITNQNNENPQAPISQANPRDVDPLTLSTKILLRLIDLVRGGRF